MEVAGYCFKRNHWDLTKRKKKETKIGESIWRTVTGVSQTNQKAGMTGPRWVRVRRVRPEGYWQLP